MRLSSYCPSDPILTLKALEHSFVITTREMPRDLRNTVATHSSKSYG